MISLPPPDPGPKGPDTPPLEAPAIDEPQEALTAEQPQEPPTADEPQEAPAPLDAGAPDDSDSPQNPEATSAGSADGVDATEPPAKRRRNAYSAMEIAAQVAQVQEWLTMGKRPNQIRQLCADEWGLLTRAAEARMHEARKCMVADVDIYVRKDKAAQMIQQLEQVLEQALQMRQGSNAIGALRLQADLLQLLSRHQ